MAKVPSKALTGPLEFYRRTVSGVEEICYVNPDGTERVLSAAGGGGGAHADTHADGGSDEVVEGSVAPSTQAFGDAAAVGADLTKAAPRLHKHGMMADPVPTHVAAGDPHTQYATNTEFDSHGIRHEFGESDPVNIAHANTSGKTANDHHAQLHHAAHEPAGGDPMAVDAAAATGSLRTLGSGATQAVSGTDARLSDSRTPLAHHSTHEPNGSDAVVVASGKSAVGSLTLPDATFMVTAGRILQSGSERITMNGSSRWVML